MCAVAIVTLVLAGSAFAGTIDSPGAVGTIDSPGAPAPAQISATSTITTTILTILGLIR